MLPSSTVENYLKAIYLAQAQLEPSELVPMGRLASALSVAPGTATTMVKALSEAGWVRYEPYTGVRLLPAGEKLAALVVRRHRLVELFLVDVMGMSWAEVHEEAERLEHAVSDRLIARIDDLLGHPRVDPHGDPIPGAEGAVPRQDDHTLLSCPLQTPVVVTRVGDQNAAFLHFVEDSRLKPGQQIEVEARDAQSDSVRVVRAGGDHVVIGARAASKLFVRAVGVVILIALGARPSDAQTPAAPSAPKFEILDNSFLVEEAFNQETGVFQNILQFVRSNDGNWTGAFTQEWPAPTVKHQLSYTLAESQIDRNDAFDDVLINYRYQVLDEGPGRPAFAPRFSVVLPTGDSETGHGSGVVGVQINLPFSKQIGYFYYHWNAGVTYLPGVKTSIPGDAVTLASPQVAASVIWRTKPMVNAMLEALASSTQSIAPAGGADRATILTLSPGVRFGWNLGRKQIVGGFAVPVTWNRANKNNDVALIGYFSCELPFRR